MKHFLGTVFMLSVTFCSAQKYALVDKMMSLPVIYANTVTVQDNLKGYFPLDKATLNEFITEIEKIAKLLTDTKKKKPEKIDLIIGSTSLHGLRIELSTEERMDITLTTEYGTSKATMHLCDAKISNANNAYYITTWIKYLRRYVN